MRDESIDSFLTRLADRVPAPGGGASAALHAAQSAALLGMVARYSTGEKYADHADVIVRIQTDTDEQRALAVQLIEDDVSAFTSVTDAYRMPKNSDDDKAARSAAIAEALAGAAKPPAQVITIADTLITVAEELLPIGNRNVITDVAAASDAARAAATTARINVEINLTGIKDEGTRDELVAIIEKVPEIMSGADRIMDAVRKEISQ